ncbi:hypothetical protein FB45DRAFT_887359 [Roridomyces roridus]|uniref:Uncharacterized protein n=1 Tax=Roridomyces roridus TaxID=1738132 RepID=A0AAD7CJ51_9AGAR|nr:hypothetical protein FB45DRAFT_887359 [Roridomyces roridus]
MLDMLLNFLWVLSIILPVFGHPVLPDESNRTVVRVTARAAPQPTCSVCATARTVRVSGTATFTASPNAVTVVVGNDNSDGGQSPLGIPPPDGIAMDFGLCSTPEIEFGAGFDGHQGTMFQPVNRTCYKLEAVPDISTVTEFICDALTTSCGANAAAQTQCAEAQAAADAAPPQEGIDADIFNKYFGIITNFTAIQPIPVLDYGGNINGTDTGGFFSAASTSSATSRSSAIPSPPPQTASRTTTSSSQPSSPPAQKATTARLSTASPSGSSSTKTTTTTSNLQVFTGSLGGVAAPSVVASGTQFQVQGDNSFNNKVDALQRSCDNQLNECSDAANRSKNQGALTVSACNTQHGQCNAANGIVQ